MLILLVGPKGSGKSHVGRLLESRCDVHFFDVEPLWLAYHRECQQEGTTVDIGEGLRRVDGQLQPAMRTHEKVAVETTGASKEILDYLLGLGEEHGLVTVGIEAPLDTCLERVAGREVQNQIPVDDRTIALIHAIASNLELETQASLANVNMSDDEIVATVSPLLERPAPE